MMLAVVGLSIAIVFLVFCACMVLIISHKAVYSEPPVITYILVIFIAVGFLAMCLHKVIS